MARHILSFLRYFLPEDSELFQKYILTLKQDQTKKQDQTGRKEGIQFSVDFDNQRHILTFLRELNTRDNVAAISTMRIRQKLTYTGSFRSQ